MKPKTNSSEEANRAYLRDLASGKVLVDGERIKVLTPEEARQRFGGPTNDLIVSPVPRFKSKP